MEGFAQAVKKRVFGRHLAQTIEYVVQDGEYQKPSGSAQGQPQEGLWS